MHLHRAVNDAEATSGLQFCVVICPDDDPIPAQVERAFEALGVTRQPAVLIAARTSDQAIHVELGPSLGDRLTAGDVREVLELCRPVDGEDLRERAAAVVLTLADRAGPGSPDPTEPELPDVVQA